jgi:MoaA/NifB/PqqE/SkfB family radical SAM enzyme
MLKSAIWWTTMTCNFKCKYCWEVQAQERGEFKREPFRPAQDWLEAWNRLRPQLLDITGGEPYLMPDFLDVLIGLDPAIRVAITSNLSHPLLEFVRHVSPECVINVTASFHPMENGTRVHPMNPEVFVGRCLFLQNHGFNVTVNVVAWPEQMYLIPAWADMFRSHGLRFHVDPYSSIAYYPYEYSEAERRFLEPWIWENRRAGLDVIKPDASITVLCSGGADHINVQPDGSAWRCILERQLAVNPLGNVFEPGFELLSSSWQCAESWQCPACDRDKVTIVQQNDLN